MAAKKFRQRKRDWPQTVYKFWARPLESLPDQIWQQGREMNQLWNELLELRKRAQDEASALEGDEKKQRWVRFNEDAKHLVKASAVNWECKAAVFDRFNTACRRAAKEHTDVHFRGGLRKINIPHRYTGGGIEIDRLLTADSTAKRLRVRPVAQEAYADSRRETTRRRLTRGVFGLANDVSFEFETILHRPIPRDAIVKQANWCGVFDRNLPPARRWTWSLQLVCEVPPERYFVEPSNPDSRGTCAIDLGWRVMADGEYIRIGLMLDDAGRSFEFRLPLFMARKRDVSKLDYYSSFYDLLKLDSRIGEGVQRAKERVLFHLGAKPQGYDKMRQRGLKNLIADATGELKAELEAWEAEDRRLCAIKASVTQRMKRRKAWLYQNLAAWLVKNYRTIVIESDLSLKKLGMEKGDYTVQNAAKYRQWAGLGELRTLLKNAAARNRCEIVGAAAAYTTVQCARCGVDSESDRRKLWMECPNGHRWDQDVNAAANLLVSQIGGDLTQIETLRKIGANGRPEVANIPEQIRAVAIQCSFQ